MSVVPVILAALLMLQVPLAWCSPIKHATKYKHGPLYDGTDATLPKYIKNNTATDKIQEINEILAPVEDMTKKEKKAIEKESKGKLFEADIVLTKQDIQDVDTSSNAGSGKIIIDTKKSADKRKGVRNRKRLWPSRNIPYEISPSFGSNTGTLRQALKEIENVSCIRFRYKNLSDKHWIKVVKKPGCWSLVGRQYLVKGAQELSIGEGCNYKQLIIHEFMHALGFWHEQSRTDRNKYVNVLWENINPRKLQNFNKYSAGEVDTAGSVYDFESLLHYSNKAFSKNGKPTLLAIKDPELQFGGKTKLSKNDINTLNALYDCSTPGGGWTSWSGYGPCDIGCTKKRARFCTNRDRSKCPNVDSEGIQEQVASCPLKECYAPIPGHWGRWSAWSECTITCGKGYRQRSRNCNDPPPMYNGDVCKGTLLEVAQCQVANPCYASASLYGVGASYLLRLDEVDLKLKEKPFGKVYHS